MRRCRVHWMRNALAHVPHKQRPAVAALLKTIFAQDTAEAARQQWNQVADRLRHRFGISRVCVVADRGMISAATIAALEDRNLE